jgi:hypothetical protein
MSNHPNLRKTLIFRITQKKGIRNTNAAKMHAPLVDQHQRAISERRSLDKTGTISDHGLTEIDSH